MSGSKCQMRKRKSICFHTQTETIIPLDVILNWWATVYEARRIWYGESRFQMRSAGTRVIKLSETRLAYRKSFSLLFHPSQKRTDNGSSPCEINKGGEYCNALPTKRSGDGGSWWLLCPGGQGCAKAHRKSLPAAGILRMSIRGKGNVCLQVSQGHAALHVSHLAKMQKIAIVILKLQKGLQVIQVLQVIFFNGMHSENITVTWWTIGLVVRLFCWTS